MFKIENSYWCGKGKYQKEADELQKLVPDYGYTDNSHMNLFITLVNFYYRRYNDGDNPVMFKRRIEKYIMPFEKELNFNIYDLDNNDEYLEELLNKAICLIKDKDLTYNCVGEDNTDYEGDDDYYDDEEEDDDMDYFYYNYNDYDDEE